MRVLLLAAGLVLLCAACDSDVGGDATRTIGVPPGASPSLVRAEADRAVDDWRTEVALQGRTGGDERFPSPSEKLLRARLSDVSERYGVRVVKVEVLHPRQDAPLVVVESRHPDKLVREAPLILGALDPQTGKGSAYEAFLFEAVDEQRVPFVITFNYWRGRKHGRHKGGGQWASRPDLYPFPHG